MSTPIVTTERADASVDTARFLFGKRRERPGRRKSKAPYFLIIPAVVALIVGTGYPVIWQTLTSFREYGLAQQFGKPAPFVGLQNYVDLLTGPDFWTIVLRSVVFCLVTAAATMVLGIGVALVMRAVSTVPRVILQISLLLAWAMPVVAQMTVWTWLVDDRNGILNYVLSKIPGVDMIGHNWLVNPLSFFAVASVIITWARTRCASSASGTVTVKPEITRWRLSRSMRLCTVVRDRPSARASSAVEARASSRSRASSARSVVSSVGVVISMVKTIRYAEVWTAFRLSDRCYLHRSGREFPQC